MTDWDSQQSLKLINFTLVDLWVHFSNIPIHFHTAKYVEKLVGLVGEYIKADLERLIKAKGPLIRVRIQVDIEKPLMARIYLEQDDHPKENIQVQYESLPLFCFCNGWIGHALKECHLAKRKRQLEGENTTIPHLYDWSLCARFQKP